MCRPCPYSKMKSPSELLDAVEKLEERVEELERKCTAHDWDLYLMLPLLYKEARMAAITLCSHLDEHNAVHWPVIEAIGRTPPDFQRLVSIFKKQRRDDKPQELYFIMRDVNFAHPDLREIFTLLLTPEVKESLAL